MDEEKKETTHQEPHAEHPIENHSNHHKPKKNNWMITSIILFIIVVILIILMIAGIGNKQSKSLSKDAAAKKLIDSLNAKTNGGVTLVSSADIGHMYQVNVSYNNQTIPVYITKDGNYFIQGITSIENSSNTQVPPKPTGPVNLTIGNSPSIGNASAKVTVIEFSDFSCPYCEAASGYNTQMSAAMVQQSPNWQPIVSNLLKDYVQTGKVRFVSKYSMGHTGGHPASLVGWCVNDQSSSLFWKFYAKAYSHTSADTENMTLMTNDAKALGADLTKLQKCLDSGKFNNTFETEQAQADAAGVQGTPAFFVNGQLFEGAVPYSQVKAVIDADLAK